MKKMMFIFLIFPGITFGQKFISDSVYVRFFSDAPIEDIQAVNTKGTSLIDLEKMEAVYSIPITGFQFEKSLMQEHFNENYLESDKYPRAIFKGKITGWDGSEGKLTATTSGEMTIHGRTNEISIEGTISRKGDRITVDAVFPITVADYKIKIPKAVFYNIAEVVEVTVHFEYEPYEGH